MVIADASTRRTYRSYMGRYAKAMLEPLPEGAVFLSAYDMQWATGRYMQDCEGVRPDISLLNTAVLSFNWFPAQAHLYPNVTFPKGKYLAKVETQVGQEFVMRVGRRADS